MCTLLCVCSPRVESLFPPVLSKSCNQIPPAFKVWLSRNSSSCCWTPRFGSLTWGSEPSLQWVDFCGISVLQFVSHPPSSYGIWFYCDYIPPTISLWLLLCLWMWGIFFGEFQCLPVDDCSAVSCDSGALARGSESTSYSAILNQSSCRCFNKRNSGKGVNYLKCEVHSLSVILKWICSNALQPHWKRGVDCLRKLFLNSSALSL